MLNPADLAELPPSSRTAIENAMARVERAAAAKDPEQVIGTSKELVETVAKVTINALGGTYGSNTNMPALVKQTLEALDLHPSGLADRPSLRRLVGALSTAVSAITELRNTDGTGHGRAYPSNLNDAHGTLARDAAVGWSRWILSATHRSLRDRPIAQVVDDISGPLTMSRGVLPALLQELRLDTRGEDDQRKLGLAVSRRWTVNGTFMPRSDVIEPLAEGRKEYPPAFAEGILEGLLLDHDGFLRIYPGDVPFLAGIADRLPADRRTLVLDALSERVSNALRSYAFGEEAQAQTIHELRQLATERGGTSVGETMSLIAQHIDDLRHADWKADEDDDDQ